MDHYEYLGIAATCSSAEIKRIRIALSKKYHPDKTGGDKSAEDKLARANAIIDLLLDPQKRLEYDRTRGRNPQPRQEPHHRQKPPQDNPAATPATGLKPWDFTNAKDAARYSSLNFVCGPIDFDELALSERVNRNLIRQLTQKLLNGNFLNRGAFETFCSNTASLLEEYSKYVDWPNFADIVQAACKFDFNPWILHLFDHFLETYPRFIDGFSIEGLARKLYYNSFNLDKRQRAIVCRMLQTIISHRPDYARGFVLDEIDRAAQQHPGDEAIGQLKNFIYAAYARQRSMRQ